MPGVSCSWTSVLRTLRSRQSTGGLVGATESTLRRRATGEPTSPCFSSMSRSGMGPSMAVEGSTTREVFETYVEEVLAPELLAGQIVVMDNLTSHKGPRVREMIEEKGCELLYLPPYSPDFNPIEEAFAKLKGLLRRAEARSRDVLIEAMGRALEAVTASDARGFFEHRGYRPLAQSL